MRDRKPVKMVEWSHEVNAESEAKQLARLVFLELETAEHAREMIQISPKQKATLAKIVTPDRLIHIVAFRERVLDHFDRMIETRG